MFRHLGKVGLFAVSFMSNTVEAYSHKEKQGDPSDRAVVLMVAAVSLMMLGAAAYGCYRDLPKIYQFCLDKLAAKNNPVEVPLQKITLGSLANAQNSKDEQGDTNDEQDFEYIDYQPNKKFGRS